VQVPAETIAEVVKDVSEKMSDANYTSVLVGGFVQEQAPAAQYLSAHADELGGPEGVVHAIFHAAVVAVCFQRAHNRSLPQISFEELDRATAGDREAELKDQQPAVLEYFEANVESEPMRRVLMLVALAMEAAS
jgi:hypothetical protein